MGSGSTRKKNDTLIINRPQPKGSAGGSGSSSSRDINRVCPAAFDVGIKPPRPTPDGTPVTMRAQELYIYGDLVGKLTVRGEATINRCADYGISYTAAVVNVRDKVYARFSQV